MAAIFENGVPAKITSSDFRYWMLAAFPKLAGLSVPEDEASADEKKRVAAADMVLNDAIQSVYDMFTGVNTLWKIADKNEWYDKAQRCYLLLAAWYIADLYPRYAVGVHSTGGMPILEKKIGDVMIKYVDSSRLGSTDAVLESLKSNRYGAKAYIMIKGAPGRFLMSVQTIVQQ